MLSQGGSWSKVSRASYRLQISKLLREKLSTWFLPCSRRLPSSLPYLKYFTFVITIDVESEGSLFSLYWAKNQIILGELYVLCSCTWVRWLPCHIALLAELWGHRRQQKDLQKKNKNLQMILITQDLCPHNQLFETPPLSIYLESTIFRPNSHFLPQVSLSRSPTCPRSRLYGALS